MTEEEFSRSVHKLMLYTAHRVAPKHFEDLAQIGAIAALQLFRKQGGENMPDIPLIVTAAKRAIWHEIRRRRRPKRWAAELLSLTGDFGDFDAPAGGDLEAETIERIDLERGIEQALEILTPEQREIVKRLLAGETQDAIAKSRGCHRSWINQLKAAAIRRIRKLAA